MRDMVAVVAILGGIMELITAIGGPELAGVDIRSDVPPPQMEPAHSLSGSRSGSSRSWAARW